MHKESFQKLGRGLASLLGDDERRESFQDVAHSAPIHFLHSGRFQPRRRFDAVGLESLVASIRRRGILQPILVRPLFNPPGHYEIVAGERRWLAAQEAHLDHVPIVVHNFSDREALEVSLVENLQRQDLSPLEEAEGYSRLIEEFHHTQEELAQAIGKSRSHVANMMRLLTLPEAVKCLLDQDTLSVGHARALLGAREPTQLAQVIVKRSLNVRQTEELIRTEGNKIVRSSRVKNKDIISLENDISNHLNLKVSITSRKKGGQVTIHYETLEQLDEILILLNATVS